MSSIFKKIRKVFWEYLTLSLVLAAMEVKKLLFVCYMFAISVGCELVVSLETRILGMFDGLLFILKTDFISVQMFLMLSQLG